MRLCTFSCTVHAWADKQVGGLDFLTIDSSQPSQPPCRPPSDEEIQCGTTLQMKSADVATENGTTEHRTTSLWLSSTGNGKGMT